MVDRRLPFDEWVLPRVPYRSTGGDVVVAVAVLALGAFVALFGLSAPPDPSLPLGTEGARWALIVICAAAVVVRRRLPLVTVSTTGAAMIAQVGLVGGSLELSSAIAFADSLYAAMLVGSARVRRIVLVVAAVVAVSMFLAARPTTIAEVVSTCLGALAIVGLSLVWGLSVRQRDALVAAERERADAVARAAEIEREHAVRAERLSMAGELHDEIAARLSAITLQTGALAAREHHDESERQALAAVRASSIEALTELRSLISMLTDDSASTEVARGLELAALQEHAASFGVDLEASVDVPGGALTTAGSNALMRIARECIANAARHAPGEPLRMRVATDGDAVVLEAHNAMRGAGDPGTGLGVDLMAERWRAVGGTGEAGAQVDGTWLVRASVPRAAAQGSEAA